MATNRRKKRVSKLKYTALQNIGWHVSSCDPNAGTPRRHRFAAASRAEAEVAYHELVAAHMRGETPTTEPKRNRRELNEQIAIPKAKPSGIATDITVENILHVNSGFLSYEEIRVGDGDALPELTPECAISSLYHGRASSQRRLLTARFESAEPSDLIGLPDSARPMLAELLEVRMNQHSSGI